MKVLYLAFFCFLSINLLSHEKFTDTYIFFVSPNGDDANPGTQQAPFLTPQRARDAVRALPSSAFKDQDVYVLFRGGTYRMQQPLVLEPIDSGREGHAVVYSSYPGESAILSGAIQAINWTPYLPLPGVYQSTVGPSQSRQLYVNGTRATRAHTTLNPFFPQYPLPFSFLPNYPSGIDYLVNADNAAAWRDPTTWTNPQNVEAVIITQWKMMRVPVASVMGVPTVGGLLVMQEPAWTNANVYYDKAINAPGVWSFWQVTRFENALEFLTEPGMWYLDYAGTLYYSPLPGENINTADVELPLLETLVEGRGTIGSPIHNIRFEGLTFAYATWLGPNSGNGYVADQSGFILVGTGHQPNFTGHDPNVVPTPGNVQFNFAHNIVFSGNIFEHLGAVGLEFGTGSQHNNIESNLFNDISSSAIVLGGVSGVDPHPTEFEQLVQYNLITNNLVSNIAADYVDAAGIFVGFTRKTTISHNTIVNTPWSGIAMGWGWGLLDKGSFPGLMNAYSGEWGTFNKLTPNYKCQIIHNRIHSFLNILWDGGAVYTTGRQGPTKDEGLLIKGNVASGKRPSGGGNIFYTDGGSRCIRLEENVSYNNPIGITFFGPPPPITDPLAYSAGPSSLNNFPYGSDSGGCVTYGDIRFSGNYWLEGSLPSTIVLNNFILNSISGFPPYSYYGFFDICPYRSDGISYPTELSYKNNHSGFSKSDVPSELLSGAGVRQRPSTIPEAKWILPPP